MTKKNPGEAWHVVVEEMLKEPEGYTWKRHLLYERLEYKTEKEQRKCGAVLTMLLKAKAIKQTSEVSRGYNATFVLASHMRDASILTKAKLPLPPGSEPKPKNASGSPKLATQAQLNAVVAKQTAMELSLKAASGLLDLLNAGMTAVTVFPYARSRNRPIYGAKPVDLQYYINQCVFSIFAGGLSSDKLYNDSCLLYACLNELRRQGIELPKFVWNQKFFADDNTFLMS